MPKPPNYQLRDKVLELIKRKYLEQGKFSMSLAEIAKFVGEKSTNTQKIMDTVNALEKSCNIRIERGVGSSSSTYEFIRDDISANIENAKQEQAIPLEQLKNAAYDSIKEIVNFTASLSRKNMELEGQVLYYEDLLLGMRQIGTSEDGTVILKTNHRSAAYELIMGNIQAKRNELVK